ncbi:MAG: ATP-binding protein [Rubrivivax sp.]|nr:ATP-binding protein [Rubrivivax sp.]
MLERTPQPPRSAAPALRIAVLGAECTGKTELVLALRDALSAERGLRVAAVMEYLREWCDERLRTPARHEQAAIAQEQQRRIEAAAAAHEIVVCDTTPLMTALYSRWYFGDDSLEPAAVAAHRDCQVTLVTGLDLPWEPDGHQRDGEHVRGPIDALLRDTLRAHAIAYADVRGLGADRLASAWTALQPWLDAADGSGQRPR